MRITKFTHACLRIEHDGAVLVVDPGVFSEAEAMRGADAVLITHEHADHVDPAKLEGFQGKVFTHEGLRLDDVDVVRVKPGEQFEAAGVTVRAHGGQHAVIHEDIPRIANIGFVLDTPDGTLYHPGDSFHVPDEPVQTLFTPVSAPWLKLAEAVDFVRAVKPERACSLHDYLLVEAGQQMVTGHLERLGQTRYTRLMPGDSL